METRISLLVGQVFFIKIQYMLCASVKRHISKVTALVICILTIFPVMACASSAKLGILPYTTESDATLQWIKERFFFKISGRSPQPSSVIWSNYYDIYGVGSIPELLLMKDWASTYGLVYEDMLLHAKVNYTYTGNDPTAWSQMDKFDNFEGAKGVMLADGTDKTTVAYSGASPYTTVNQTLYVGYEEPFDQMNLDIRTPANTLVGTWQYWNGSAWSTLESGHNFVDGTSAMTVDGAITFTPPSNWTRTVVNSSRNKYFVRFAFTSASIVPVINTIKGDNWLRGANNLVRGWDSTSGSIVNTGELKYNPTPPAEASAKFPYQARLSFWSSNHFAANPANFQNYGGSSVRSWSKYAAKRINDITTASGATAIMCDDGERNIAEDGIAASNTDFVGSWWAENENRYQDIVTYAHELNPNLKVGINAQAKSLAGKGDWNLAEYHLMNWKTADNMRIATTDSSYMCYDDYLPANNPTGKLGVLIYQDTEATVPGAGAAWDLGNRGPLVALSHHYIAKNDNTIFSYYSRGGYVYSETDEVYLKDSTVRRQSVDAIPPVDQVARWGTYFPAMGVDIGIPDVNGWNAGVRSFEWKPGAEIGGGWPVWRRDFTNAVILHRAASWHTTADQYNTYSSPIDLGGTYYPLQADGATGAAITSIALRTAEGAILMKSSVTVVKSAPPAAIPPVKNKTLQRWF